MCLAIAMLSRIQMKGDVRETIYTFGFSRICRCADWGKREVMGDDRYLSTQRIAPCLAIGSLSPCCCSSGYAEKIEEQDKHGNTVTDKKGNPVM
jgi:hypothetical protein